MAIDATQMLCRLCADLLDALGGPVPWPNLDNSDATGKSLQDLLRSTASADLQLDVPASED